MNIIQKIKSYFNLSSKMDGLLISEIIKTEYGTSEIEEYTGSIYNASTLWALQFAKAKFRVYEKKAQNITEVLNENVLKLFLNPNEYESWWEIAYKIPVLFAFFGEAVLLVYRNGSFKEENGNVQYIQLLPPKTYRKVFGKKGLEFYILSQGKEEYVPLKNIIHIKYPNPFTNINGHAIINSIFDVLTVEKIQLEYMKRYWSTGGFMGLTFSTEQNLSKVQYSELLNRLRERYEGTGKSFKVGLITNGLKPIKTSYSMKDHDMTEQRLKIKDEIYEAFKVNKILIGGGGSNRAEAEAHMYNFTSNVIEPLLSYLDVVFTKFYKENYNKNYFVQHDNITPKDNEFRLRMYESALKNGWLTINEVREMEGWGKYKYEFADKPYVNVGGALIDVSNAVQISQEPIDTKSLLSHTDYLIQKADNNDIKEQFINRHNIWTRRFGTKLENYYYDQQRRVLDAVLNNYIVEQAFNLENENLVLSQLLEIDLWDIMKEGYDYGDLLYNTQNYFQKQALESDFYSWLNNFHLLNKYIFEEVRILNKEEEIKEKYEKFINQNVKSLVVGSVTSCLNAGLLMAMKDAGIKNKMWLTYRDDRVRNRLRGENHVVMDGVSIPVEAYFQVPSRNNYDFMLYPGDPNGSKENIINCRCTIISGD